MLSKFKDFVKNNLNEILVIAAVILVSLFSFAAGYLTARYQEKESIRIEGSENP